MNDRRMAAALFALALVPYVYFYGGWGANQEVSYALTRAMWEARTFHVDDFTPHDGDIAAGVGGHIYINKPPGLSALAYPGYVFQFKIQQRGWVTFREYWQTNKQIVTVEVCGAGGALIAPILYLYGRRRLGVPPWNATLVAIAVAFGTILFPYSTMFFAHVPSALFLLLAFVLLRDHPLLAGAAAGIAGACFFLSAVAAVALAALALWYGARKAALFVAGGLPFALALAVYQRICFGSFFTTPVERSVSFTDRRLLFGVFGRPRLDALWGITFSEYRGLFYASPVLLFAFAGAVVMLRRRLFRAELAAVAGVAVIYIGSIASFNGWHGGAAFGPRYLVPIVPLLGIPMMFAAGRGRWLWLAALSLSAAIQIAATAVDAMPEPFLPRPLTRYILPTLFTQRVPPDTRAALYPDCKSARCVQKKVALPPDARNFGEPLLGTGRAATLLPALLWIVSGSWWLLSLSRRAATGSSERPRKNGPQARGGSADPVAGATG